jgi:hypothetical protein
LVCTLCFCQEKEGLPKIFSQPHLFILTPLGQQSFSGHLLSTLIISHFGGICHCEEPFVRLRINSTTKQSPLMPLRGIASPPTAARNDECDIVELLTRPLGKPLLLAQTLQRIEKQTNFPPPSHSFRSELVVVSHGNHFPRELLTPGRVSLLIASHGRRLTPYVKLPAGCMRP